MLPTASAPMSGPIESVFTGEWTCARVHTPARCVGLENVYWYVDTRLRGGCVLLLNWTLLSVRERRSNRSGVLRDHPCTQRPRPSLSVNHCSTRYIIPFRFSLYRLATVQPFSPRISSERSITGYIPRACLRYSFWNARSFCIVECVTVYVTYMSR